VIISNTEKYKHRFQEELFMKIMAFDERQTNVGRSTYWTNVCSVV
jgi:hypothetical protein